VTVGQGSKKITGNALDCISTGDNIYTYAVTGSTADPTMPQSESGIKYEWDSRDTGRRLIILADIHA